MGGETWWVMGGFGWEKVNLLWGIFVSSSCIESCLILVVYIRSPLT